jgi:two-component system response regulator AtoC
VNTEPEEPTCQQVVDSFPEPFVVIDRNYRILVANRRYGEHYGFRQAEVVGRCCHEVSHRSSEPCSAHGEHCPLEQVFSTAETTQVMHVHYDGKGREERVRITATPLLGKDGEVQFIGESLCPVAQVSDETLLIGRSRSMLHMVSLLQRVAPTQTTVLLLGESGVGKECAAQYVHRYSARSEGPFVVVDCGTLGQSLIESELFGHEKGSFTGAGARKLGLFEAAQGGTLLIDEVCELPLKLQTKLLRALETGTIRRIGGNNYRRVDVRVVAATNRDPQAMVRGGEFREDLYYRLSAFPIRIPPLRERKDDIPALAAHLVGGMEQGDHHLPLAPEVIESLLEHEYPGNVRELRNILERAVILAAGELLTPQYLVFDDQSGPVGGTGRAGSQPLERDTLAGNRLITRRGNAPEEAALLEALERAGGHRGRAAALLGISERTLYRHLGALRRKRRRPGRVPL